MDGDYEWLEVWSTAAVLFGNKIVRNIVVRVAVLVEKKELEVIMKLFW